MVSESHSVQVHHGRDGMVEFKELVTEAFCITVNQRADSGWYQEEGYNSQKSSLFHPAWHYIVGMRII